MESEAVWPVSEPCLRSAFLEVPTDVKFDVKFGMTGLLPVWSCAYSTRASGDSGWARRRRAFESAPRPRGLSGARALLDLRQADSLFRLEMLIGDDLEVPAFRLLLPDSLDTLVNQDPGTLDRLQQHFA